jgi:hypothetical protein
LADRSVQHQFSRGLLDPLRLLRHFPARKRTGSSRPKRGR